MLRPPSRRAPMWAEHPRHASTRTHGRQALPLARDQQPRQDAHDDPPQRDGTDHPRRTAFFTQDSATLGLIGDPTHCELTWDYDIVTDTHIRRIWVSAGRRLGPLRGSDGQKQAQYATWRKRDMKWLPGHFLPTPPQPRRCRGPPTAGRPAARHPGAAPAPRGTRDAE